MRACQPTTRPPASHPAASPRSATRTPVLRPMASVSSSASTGALRQEIEQAQGLLYLLPLDQAVGIGEAVGAQEPFASATERKDIHERDIAYDVPREQPAAAPPG